MIKRIAAILFYFVFSLGFAQNEDAQWKGYFSYNQVKDITESNNSFFAATENALFSENLSTNVLKTINSIDGLKTETITAVYHSDTFNKTLIGNNNGLLLVVNPDGSILYKSGIVDEVTLSPVIKRINNFNEYNGKVYISCDYGITVFDLTTSEFGQTYYMGPQGTYIKVTQTCVNNGYIYAATRTNTLGSGIRKASITSQFLDDYNQWIDQTGYEWYGIANIGTDVFAMRADNRLFKLNGTTFVEFTQFSEPIIDFRTYGDYVVVTTENHVYVYNSALQLMAHIQSNQVTDVSVTFSCATVINDGIYIGTNENGVLSSSISNPTNFQFIMPDGPVKNYVFRVKKTDTALWALYGRYNRDYNPYNLEPPYGIFQYPISKFTDQNGWSFIPYDDIFGAKSLSNIVFNPDNPKEFYVSSYFSGLLKVVDEVPQTLYDDTNTGSSGIETTSAPVGFRINGPAYDKEGNLWMTNNMVLKGLKVLKANGQWQSYDMSEVIPEANLESYGILVIDKNNTKWIPTFRNGLVAYNEIENKKMQIKNDTQGNLPEIDVRCLAIDNRNQLWIGTSKGLRIIPSVDLFLSSETLSTKSIIILEDGLAQELFYEQFILDIAVDGSNRKWVSTADSGVFLVSSNGQETIYHFTKENSPLPSDNIIDIEIDGITGEVYFATDKGLVSFKGTATKPKEDLNNVYVYPNPVRPEFTGTVKITGLTNKATVKITDVGGNLVYETTSEGGTIEWDTTAFGKYKVASGVYMILISAEDGIETTVKKVMIIR